MIKVKLSVKSDGIDRLVRNMDAADDFGHESMGVMLDSISLVILSAMQTYPPETEANWYGPRGGQPGYIRTYEVQQSWDHELDSFATGWTSRIWNSVPRSGWLHSRDHQQWWALEKGWPTLENVAEIVIEDYLNGAGLVSIAEALQEGIVSGDFNEDEIAAIDELAISGDSGLGVGTPFG